MSTKTRFDRLPKRDREEVLRIDGLQASRAASPIDNVAAMLRRLRQHRQNAGARPAGSLLASALHHLKSDFCDRGIIDRFLKNDPAELQIGVDTAARLGFLMSVAGGTDFSSYDCSHVFDLLLALAANDTLLVDAFLNRFPPPFHSGHPATVLLANGLYAVLRDDRSTFASLETSFSSMSESKFFRAMFDCLLGIMAQSTTQVEASISEMVHWNRRQEQLNSAMQKLICLTGHAYLNLCRRVFLPRGISPPTILDDSTWDGEFQEVVQASDGAAVFFDFSPISNVLAKWIAALPPSVDLDELLAQAS